MGRNALRIVCNPYNSQISYYFRNEKGLWTVLSGDSPLSRQYYTNTTMRERAKEIAEKIDEIYNRNNKGLDILLEGSKQSFDYFKVALEQFFPDQDIVCVLGVTKIAVLGKANIGKTCLIEGMENLQGYKYSIDATSEYLMYSDEGNLVEWYEIKGIDLGVENVENAYQTISRLAENGLATIVYCINASTGRLEDIEREFIQRIINENPSITILIALTMSIKTDVVNIKNEIERVTDQMKVIVTLAKDYEFDVVDEKTGEEKSIVKKSFGLDVLSKYIFERR